MNCCLPFLGLSSDRQPIQSPSFYSFAVADAAVAASAVCRIKSEAGEFLGYGALVDIVGRPDRPVVAIPSSIVPDVARVHTLKAEFSVISHDSELLTVPLDPFTFFARPEKFERPATMLSKAKFKDPGVLFVAPAYNPRVQAFSLAPGPSSSTARTMQRVHVLSFSDRGAEFVGGEIRKQRAPFVGPRFASALSKWLVEGNVVLDAEFRALGLLVPGKRGLKAVDLPVALAPHADEIAGHGWFSSNKSLPPPPGPAAKAAWKPAAHAYGPGHAGGPSPVSPGRLSEGRENVPGHGHGHGHGHGQRASLGLDDPLSFETALTARTEPAPPSPRRSRQLGARLTGAQAEALPVEDAVGQRRQRCGECFPAGRASGGSIQSELRAISNLFVSRPRASHDPAPHPRKSLATSAA
eukprot:tig00021493_g21867.t1